MITYSNSLTMKTKLIKEIIAVLAAIIPGIASAQWSMVRFDEFNYFTKIETTTPDAALSFGLLSQTSNSFIIRTNDGGTTWDSLDLNVSGNGYMIGCVNFTDIQNGYAGGISNGTQALVRTNDNGTTWTDVTPDPTIAYQINGISFIDPQNGFAADQIKVYRTNNAGATWNDFTPGMSIKDIGFASMDVGFVCGSMNPFAAVMKTVDGGQTWSNVLNATLPVFTSSSMQKIDVVNQDAVFVSGQYSNIIFKTLDGGVTWDTITVAAIYEIMDFDFTSETQGHLVSGMGEIYGTSDGGLTWTLEYSVASGAYGPSVFLTSISFAGTTGYVCGTNGLIKKYETSTGLTENTTLHNINIYPNPISKSEVLNLGKHEGEFVVELFDVAGKLVMQKFNSELFDVQNINAGIYSVKVTTTKYVQQGKVVVVE